MTARTDHQDRAPDAASHSRRGLLTGAAGALGVLAAESIATAQPAAAPVPVLLGQPNNGATALTSITTTTGESAVLANPSSGRGVEGLGTGRSPGVFGAGGISNGIGVDGSGGGNGAGVRGTGGGNGPGVKGSGSIFGSNGVEGDGTGNGDGVTGGGAGSGAGVTGFGGALDGAGVSGTGGTGHGPGVKGTGGNTGGNGVEGFGTGNGGGVTGLGAGNGTGVTGQGGPDNGGGVTGIGTGSQIGVFGRGGTGGGPGVAGAGGTIGLSGDSNGVEGFAGNSGDGVAGSSPAGNGVHGTATAAGGVGVLAENTAGGVAFRASGPAVFSRSGTLTIPAGKTSATKTGIPLTAASLVLATLQRDKAGLWVRSAVPNVAGSSFAVHLSKAPSASTKVAWFIVN